MAIAHLQSIAQPLSFSIKLNLTDLYLQRREQRPHKLKILPKKQKKKSIQALSMGDSTNIIGAASNWTKARKKADR